MATLFVNVPVKDLERSQAFFSELGFDFFGMAPGMASVMVNQEAQVMLLEEPTFASFASKPVGDPATSTQAIFVLGLDNPAEVDELVDKALARYAGGHGHERRQHRPVPARLRRPRRPPLGGPVPDPAAG